MNDTIEKLLNRMKAPPSVLVILEDADEEDPATVSECEFGHRTKLGQEIRGLADYFRTDDLTIWARLLAGETITTGQRHKARFRLE